MALKMKIYAVLLCVSFIVHTNAQPECTENTGVFCAFGETGCEGQGCCEDTVEPTCYIPDTPPEGPPGECDATDAEKEDCGELATDRESCLDAGCCWKPLPDSAPYPWCFFSSTGGGSTTTGSGTTTIDSGTTTIDSGTTTTGSGTTTIDSGTTTIDSGTTTTIALTSTTTEPDNNGTNPEFCDVTEQFPCNTGDLTCLDMGCCYDPDATLPCWHSEAPPKGPPGGMCDQTIEEKVDCGVLGTDMDECIEVYGCCWQTRPESDVYDPWCYEPLPEVKATPCSPDPCVYGECVEFKRGHYECDCRKGFIGRHCQIAINLKHIYKRNDQKVHNAQP